jgi:hypothetical protein
MDACNHRVMRRASMEFTLMALRHEAHDICVLNLPHGCDNMVDQFAKKAKVLVYHYFSQW